MQYNHFNSTAMLNSNPLVSFHNNHNTKQLPEKFVNLLMKHGNKSKAYNILYNALQILHRKKLVNSTNKKVYKFLENSHQKNIHTLHGYSLHDSLKTKNFTSEHTNENIFSKKLLTKALNNIKPNVEVRNVKVSGKTYMVPAIIYKKRQQTLAIRWIIEACKKRKQNSNIDFSECLALELYEALNKQGKACQKKHGMHKLAESNRAYMRFKWW